MNVNNFTNMGNFYVISLQVLTKKSTTLEGHIKIHPPSPPALPPPYSPYSPRL